MSHKNQIDTKDPIERRRFWGTSTTYLLGALAIVALLTADVCRAGDSATHDVVPVPSPGPVPVETYTLPRTSFILLRPNPRQRCFCLVAKIQRDGFEERVGRCACETIEPWEKTVPAPKKDVAR